MKKTKLKESLFLVKLTFTVFALCFMFDVAAQFGGGEGTEESPYIISRHDHLNNIKLTDGDNNYLYLNAHYRQNADIIFTEDMFQEGGVYYHEGSFWRPIGTSDNRFTGVYDGSGFIIAHLKSSGSRSGLFAFTEGAIIRNVNIVDIHIPAAGWNVGALAGDITSTLIENCSSTGSIFNNGTGQHNAGLIGYAVNSVIKNSFSEVNLESTGAPRVGGLVGFLNASDAINCYATGVINNPGHGVSGGLVGLAGRWNIGEGSSRIINCYATGPVTGRTQIGGLIGTLQVTPEITNSYSTGLVEGEGGGLIGQGAANMTNCYWDVDRSSKETSAGGDGAVGKNSVDMIYPAYLDNADNIYVNWDFASGEVWAHDVTRELNNGYPVMHYQDAVPPPERPEVAIDKVIIDDVPHVRISWQPVEGALSYKIYASTDAFEDDWGQPVAIIGGDESQYTQEISEDRAFFYFVVASADEAP